ncbi:tetratricopeptide repeat protein [Aestuariispira insulae]|uniref:Sel1 repeat-containing protein n=1 Tax=Aestuariispira insulae TaxID=1461337 RepID=A0A3D9HRG5_9PROT|nr:tetratricopeptide repeat protein [Aestuariispira insulae]RED52049.1 Sel1 repeat-containing protein [Aestuariispira insulae]
MENRLKLAALALSLMIAACQSQVQPTAKTEPSPHHQAELDRYVEMYRNDQSEEAVQGYLKLAEEGFPEAMYALSIHLNSGLGIEQNSKQAFEWSKKAFENGYKPAAAFVGESYYVGNGVVKNITKAVPYLTEAADQGNMHSMFYLGTYYYTQNDPANSVKWTKKAAELGHASASNNLGIFYETGFGIDQSYRKARRSFIRAARKGAIASAYSVSNLSFEGKTGEPDPIDYLKWLYIAIELHQKKDPSSWDREREEVLSKKAKYEAGASPADLTAAREASKVWLGLYEHHLGFTSTGRS